MPAERHAETARGRDYMVAGYPAAWSGWSFEAKVRWLIGNTSPRANYGEACALLAGHAKARREAEKQERAEVEARHRAAPRTQGLSLAHAGLHLVRFGTKHAGKTLREIAAADPDYVEWLAGRKWINGRLREAVLIVLDHLRLGGSFDDQGRTTAAAAPAGDEPDEHGNFF